MRHIRKNSITSLRKIRKTFGKFEFFLIINKHNLYIKIYNIIAIMNLDSFDEQSEQGGEDISHHSYIPQQAGKFN